jgi:hypothetical protein
MSRTSSLFGLLIMIALITAGCTGTKTMVGTGQFSPAAGQSAAHDDYAKYSGELRDEINYLKNHYTISQNTTLDEYKVWLDGYKDKLELCRQMYNNTSAASKKYLGFLNASSDEYRNVTSDDAIFTGDIAALNLTYWQNSDYLNVSIKKMAAMDVYRNKLNGTMDDYNDINGFAKDAKVSSIEDYGHFVDGFGTRTKYYEDSVKEAVSAGNDYLAYCDPASDEYKSVQENNNALTDNVKKCWDAYNNYKKDFDSKIGAKSAAQSTFKDYVSKLNAASSAQKDLDSYRNTAKALDKLDRGWLDGYRQQIDAFSSACGAAISTGQACQQYLDASSSDYKSIQNNEKNMKDSMSYYQDNYRKMESTYKNLHPLGSFMK